MATVRYNEAQGWVWLHTPTLNISFHVNAASLTRAAGWQKYVAGRFHKLGFCKRTDWEKTPDGYKAEYAEIQYDKRKNANENVVALARVR